jgi:hypothetical protein
MSKGLPSFGMVSHAALPTFHGKFGRAAEIMHVKIVPYIPVVFVLVLVLATVLVVLSFFILLTDWSIGPLQAVDSSLLLCHDPQDLEPAHVAMAAISAEHLGPSSQVILQLIWSR